MFLHARGVGSLVRKAPIAPRGRFGPCKATTDKPVGTVKEAYQGVTAAPPSHSRNTFAHEEEPSRRSGVQPHSGAPDSEGAPSVVHSPGNRFSSSYSNGGSRGRSNVDLERVVELRGEPSLFETILSSLEDEADGPTPLPFAEGGSKASGLKAMRGWLAPLGAAGGVLLLLGGGILFKDQIGGFISFFTAAVDDWGALGYVAFALVYAGLEILAVPAIPLTMTAGAIFGVLPGTALVSVAATAAATVSFLIARYAVRDKIVKFAEKNPNWVAIDRAIGRDGFKFVTLLRLSPLLPLSLSNYLYGLTSVDLGSYVAGSWLGMLPGTYAYISAGHVGKAVLTQGEGSLNVDPWQVAVGLGVTALAVGFVGRLAKNAIDEVQDEGKRQVDEALRDDELRGE